MAWDGGARLTTPPWGKGKKGEKEQRKDKKSSCQTVYTGVTVSSCYEMQLTARCKRGTRSPGLARGGRKEKAACHGLCGVS